MKYKIALVVGGYTKEYNISIQDIDYIISNFDKNLYEVYVIFIEKNYWYYINRLDNTKIIVNKNDFSLNINNIIIKFDLAFINMHGSPGEDGKLKGYFDMINIPYTSSNYITSAICMNKRISKLLIKKSTILNINVPKFIYVNNLNRMINIDYISNYIKFPFFVKANNLGSSIGVFKVYNLNQYILSLNAIFQEDNEMIIEEYIKGKEFSISVFKYKNDVIVLPITEIIHNSDFFDYEAKYNDFSNKNIILSNINGHNFNNIIKVSKDIYNFFNCSGIIRLDFIKEIATNKWFFLEINIIPAINRNSISSIHIRNSTYSMQDFYNILINEALNKI